MLQPAHPVTLHPPTADELVARANAMIPWLRERAASIEAERCVPSDVIQAFQDAGFFRILQPRAWGGWEMDPEVFWRVLMELGRGCCNSAWNMMILGVHQWEIPQVSDQAMHDVWGSDPTCITASSYSAFGTITEVEGGYRLHGTWRSSSGCDHADWAFIGGMVKDDAGLPADHCAFLVPASQFRIEDDWYAFGLCGTGSKSLILDNVFVPLHRVHSIVHYQLSDRAAPYLLPFRAAFCGSVSAVICGFAQGAIDTFTEQMQVRTNTNNGVKAALSPYVRDRLGNAVARVRGARARLFGLLQECRAYTERSQLVPDALRVQHSLDMARVGRECEEAVLLLYKSLGARGIMSDNPFQRFLRDTLAATNHITQNADDNAGNLGGYLLGTDEPPFLLKPRIPFAEVRRCHPVV